MDTAQRHQSLFIVRIACEPGQAGGQWRGSVEHVPSGLRLCFVSFNDLNDFIAVRLNLTGPPAPAGDGAPPPGRAGEH